MYLLIRSTFNRIEIESICAAEMKSIFIQQNTVLRKKINQLLI